MKKIDEKITIREAILWIIALVIITTPITGCVGPKTVAMIPDFKSMSDIRINKSVNIMDVTGGKESTYTRSFVTNEKFKEALIATIEKSHIFKAVTDHDSDLDLYAMIKTQDQQYPTGPGTKNGFSTRSRLIVGYKFINNDDGRVIWHETYQSDFGSAALVGSTRINRACEGSIRENLSFFIEGINKRWPNKVD
jgi:hypothetical protein